jgi:predicted protein tyrosine phosphatase
MTLQRNLTSEILQLTTPYNNKYQGSSKRLLFVCSVGLLRSPTSASVAIKQGYNARSCGSDLYHALIPLSVNLIAWADTIVFINKVNYIETINREWDGWLDMIKSKAVIWRIEDEYDYNDPYLIAQIEDKLKELT